MLEKTTSANPMSHVKLEVRADGIICIMTALKELAGGGATVLKSAIRPV